ncbi:Uu.00g054870.m01.CDS01 [Anthostomella pinea]|uniref:Uu.00g054870.m01.CDS01 n=1 Tax=Anthostomella pinea TaxID=933095 RepID=A0AAI8VWN8_9PEZI|nr:Uu.00g054870.m01.CDS01 [Anthostomella pinea]
MSGYDFCAKRGSKLCFPRLERHLWTTFCPDSRKGLRGRQYSSGMRGLPRCCNHLDSTALSLLCLKCNSDPADGRARSRWWCADHHQRLPADVDLDPQAEFDKCVNLWPADMQRRYFRRRDDRSASGSRSM